MGCHEHLLQHVLGVLRGVEQVPAERQQPRLVAVEQDLEGAVVPVANQRDESFVALQAQQRRAPREQTAMGAVVRAEASMHPFLKNTLLRTRLRFQPPSYCFSVPAATPAETARPRHNRDVEPATPPKEPRVLSALTLPVCLPGPPDRSGAAQSPLTIPMLNSPVPSAP